MREGLYSAHALAWLSDLWSDLRELRSVRQDRLLPESEWQIDLDHLEEMADEKTSAILVNSPSNPCGSLFSEHHMKEILALADQLKLPIIAD